LRGGKTRTGLMGGKENLQKNSALSTERATRDAYIVAARLRDEGEEKKKL